VKVAATHVDFEILAFADMIRLWSH